MLDFKTEKPNSSAHQRCRCVPLVIVEGFLGGASSIIWGDFTKYLNQDCHECQRKIIFSSVGPVSSLHDRACELYYSLVGGTVDYGEEHSILHSHSRFGRTHAQGLYPHWSRWMYDSQTSISHKARSFWLPCASKLDTLGQHYISSVPRHTGVYILGERVDAAPYVRPFSLGAIVAKGVHIISYLSPILSRAIDLHAESRHMSLHDISIVSLLRQLWKSDWAESRDATPFDVTFEAADEREADGEGEPHRGTFYRSCATYMTQKDKGERSTHSVRFQFLSMLSPFFFMARSIGTFDFSVIRPIPSFLNGSKASVTNLSEEYWANDGVVPLVSQWHPFSTCSPHRCQHSEARELPESGVWIVLQIKETSHLSLVPFWVASPEQKQFWTDLGRWLRTIENIDVLLY
ncbi:hypothetical protein GYMLUDRAFT_291035 [Collybiopsis luxurians FD-317 M1]|nr:hypothetical protein GYMLUDRAFT_291035 [Collybiopsis luxurians FD-317 M1]